MQRLSVQITKQLIQSGYISLEHEDAYIYCYDYLVENIKYDAIILITSLFLHRFFITLTFLILFNILRHFSCGYHAKNRFVCNIMSYSIFGFFIFGSYLLSPSYISLLLPLFSICIFIIGRLSPVENHNKKYNTSQKKCAKKYIFFTLITASALFLLFFNHKNISCCYALTYCVMVIAGSLLTQTYMNRFKDITDSRGDNQ